MQMSYSYKDKLIIRSKFRNLKFLKSNQAFIQMDKFLKYLVNVVYF